jgi:AAA domain (dynein-related subfamily)
MPPKADLNQKGWKYHFNRRDRAAGEGRHLPMLEELHCGMSFLNESLPHDAQTWSERIIPCLSQQGQGLERNSVQTALERLSVSVSIENLTFACDEVKKFEATPEKALDVQCAARRLPVYRVAGGDVTAWPLLCEDLVSRIRKLPRDSDELFEVASTLFGLMLNNDRLPWKGGRHAHSLGDFLTDGASMLFRLIKSARVREEKGDGNSEVKDSTASLTDEAPEPNIPGHSILVFSHIGNETGETKARFSSSLTELVGKKIPLKMRPELQSVRKILAEEFPYAVGVTDVILSGLAQKEYIAIQPTVLVGPPGCGKTTFAQRFGKLLNLPFEIYPCAGIK